MASVSLVTFVLEVGKVGFVAHTVVVTTTRSSSVPTLVPLMIIQIKENWKWFSVRSG